MQSNLNIQQLNQVKFNLVKVISACNQNVIFHPFRIAYETKMLMTAFGHLLLHILIQRYFLIPMCTKSFRLTAAIFLSLSTLASKFSEEQETQKQSINQSHLALQWLPLDCNPTCSACFFLISFLYVCKSSDLSPPVCLHVFSQDSQVRQSTTYSLHQPQGNKEHGTERSGYLYKKSDG